MIDPLPSPSPALAGVRQPTQARSRERVQRIFAAAESLAETHPIADITVVMLSERSGINRSTIYQFFPTVAALLNALGQKFLDELYADHLTVAAQKLADWRLVIDRSTDITVEFYSRHPAACSLFLGDGSLHGLRLIDQDFDRRYVDLLREMMGNVEGIRPTSDGDPVQLAVTASISTLALSVHVHKRITDYYRRQAQNLAKACLAPFLD